MGDCWRFTGFSHITSGAQACSSGVLCYPHKAASWLQGGCHSSRLYLPGQGDLAKRRKAKTATSPCLSVLSEKKSIPRNPHRGLPFTSCWPEPGHMISSCYQGNWESREQDCWDLLGYLVSTNKILVLLVWKRGNGMKTGETANNVCQPQLLEFSDQLLKDARSNILLSG